MSDDDSASISPSVSDDDSASVSDLLMGPISITIAYTILFTHLRNILKYCKLSALKRALIRQALTPDGVELGDELKKEIKRTKSNSHLLDVLEEFQCCNWLDIRLLEVLAYASKLSNAIELIKAYQKLLFPRKLVDVLSKKLEHAESKEKYIAAVRTKTKMDPHKISIEEFLKYQWKIEDVILDLGKRVLNIDHVRIGCLETSYHMPVKYHFNAYKMALHNYCKFFMIDLMSIEIGSHPLISNPWLSDLEKHSIKDTLITRCEGKFSKTLIVLING